MANVVDATPSGPGLLVSWPALPSAPSAYHVFAAREPSPTFYPLPSSCCPLLPTQRPPCCPVRGNATSLQVEGLDAGVSYRFRVLADVSNETVGESAAVRVPSVPFAPGPPHVAASSDGAVVDLTWAAPEFDGDDLIRGYRIWADVPTLNATGLVLVANTSAGRPLSAMYERAPPAHVRLPLMPLHRYRLAVQALNAAGGGPLSPATAFDAPEPPAAQFEVPIGGWRRGQVSRGGAVRHRTFLPVGCERALVQLQQATAAGASLRERQSAAERTALHLYLRAGAPPELTLAVALEASPPPARDVGLYSDRYAGGYTVLPREGTPLPRTLLNASAAGGELSISISQPESGWFYLMVHGAVVSGEALGYDLLVRAFNSSGASLQQPPPSHSGLYDPTTGLYDTGGGAAEAAARAAEQGVSERHAILSSGWRYLVDPEGPTHAHPSVVSRYLHPSS